MVLNREERQLPVPDSLDGAVVQIEVGHLEAGCSRNLVTLSNYCEAMILSRDKHLVVPQIPDRMVPAPVAVRQLGG